MHTLDSAIATITVQDLGTSARGWSQAHRYDYCGMPVYGRERSADLAPMAAAFYTGGAAGLIAATKGGTRNGHICRAWELAMTAEHGPVGTHATQGEHPLVIEAKARALANLRTYLGV